MNSIFETERLRLREFTLEDTTFIIELLNTAGWLQFIGDRNVRTEEQATKYLEDGPLKSYRENGFGLSLVELKETTEPIGMCGLLKRNYLEKADIGFAFLPAFSGQGYAFEIASALLVYAKEKLNIPAVMAITVPTNDKSIKLLEKIGLSFNKVINAPPTNEALHLYSQNE